MNRLRELHEAGVSIWLDTIRRSLITSGTLQRMVDQDALTGVTSNPTIFEKAISGSSDYDEPLRVLLADGVTAPLDLFFALGLEDIGMAADVFLAPFRSSRGEDGFGSFELTPDLAHDVRSSIEQATDLWARLNRPNVMIKVPATEAGVPVIEELTARGMNVNVTLLFGVDRYAETARAYQAGIERRLAAGQPVDGIASVASFFVSRVDTAVDRLLPDDSPLRGKVAVANARKAYRRFRKLFAGPRWEAMAAAGARVQRPLWASTGTKNPAYSDVLYVEELIGPDCINTMPESTMRAFADHGVIRSTIEPNLADADRVLAQAEEAGVDLAAVTAQLEDEGVEAFMDSYLKLLAVIEEKVEAIGSPATRRRFASPDGLEEPVARRLARFDQDDTIGRIWKRDHTVWRDEPTEITDRLGWLTVHEVMHERCPELVEFAQSCAADGLTHAVLAGMGGSSLAPEVLRSTFGVAPGMLDLSVLDTTHPDQILDLERSIPLDHTLFLIASKSGTTTETLSHFAHFWEQVPDGSRFVAVTDPGTPLEALAVERGFRAVFANPPDIGGRYSALSYFGLVPAALIGADLDALLDGALEAAHACAPYVQAADDPGAWLGAMIGEGALAGRDKLTLVLDDSIRSFGYWVEQLVAESTGKEGKGVVPVEGEDLGPPDAYGADRLFVGVGPEGIDTSMAPLEAAGHPVARVELRRPLDLGGQFFQWEFAVAVAGAVLGINPFDQPNVQEAKDTTKRLLAAGEIPDPGYDDLGSILKEVRAGDYVAIQAYLPRTEVIERLLHATRMRLRDEFKVATTVGFGPRYLHSTGQLHKGGPNTGVFIQVVEPPQEDVPIPGQPYSFGTLIAAQAAGDLESLRARGRRIARVRLTDLDGL